MKQPLTEKQLAVLGLVTMKETGALAASARADAAKTRSTRSPTQQRRTCRPTSEDLGASATGVNVFPSTRSR
jgi:hypothetical protein